MHLSALGSSYDSARTVYFLASPHFFRAGGQRVLLVRQGSESWGSFEGFPRDTQWWIWSIWSSLCAHLPILYSFFLGASTYDAKVISYLFFD